MPLPEKLPDASGNVVTKELERPDGSVDDEVVDEDAHDPWEEPTPEELLAWSLLMDVPKGVWGRERHGAVEVRPACLN
jgi:hypothetical protein